MVRLGLVALDGTKIQANAAAAATRTHADLEVQVAELLQQAAEADSICQPRLVRGYVRAPAVSVFISWTLRSKVL
jgi:hypothetical protein